MASPQTLPSASEELESEYLCTLQPPLGSALAQKFKELRAAAQTADHRADLPGTNSVAGTSTVTRTVSSEEEASEDCDSANCGLDATALYPPHVSVTGFFKATAQQVAQLCAEVDQLVRDAPAGTFSVDLRKIVSTDTGHVLIDVAAPGVAELAQNLALRAKQHGMSLRPKAVRHLSLASGRSPAEQFRIAGLYEKASPAGHCQFELVVAHLVRRSDLQRLRSHGEAHCFHEILRMPLPFVADDHVAPGAEAAQAVHAAAIAIAPGASQEPVLNANNVSTPVRKRPVCSSTPGATGGVLGASSAPTRSDASSAAGFSVANYDEFRQTPPKLVKTAALAPVLGASDSAIAAAKCAESAKDQAHAVHGVNGLAAAVRSS